MFSSKFKKKSIRIISLKKAACKLGQVNLAANSETSQLGESNDRLSQNMTQEASEQKSENTTALQAYKKIRDRSFKVISHDQLEKVSKDSQPEQVLTWIDFA